MNPNDKPNDKSPGGNETFEDPKLFLVVGDEVFPRPGLETVFADISEDDRTGSARSEDDDDKGRIYGGVCACNKVRVVSCGCVGYTPCSCVGYSAPRSGSRRPGGCKCAPVS
jgi:hypothetical protein